MGTSPQIDQLLISWKWILSLPKFSAVSGSGSIQIWMWAPSLWFGFHVCFVQVEYYLSYVCVSVLEFLISTVALHVASGEMPLKLRRPSHCCWFPKSQSYFDHQLMFTFRISGHFLFRFPSTMPQETATIKGYSYGIYWEQVFKVSQYIHW